MVCAREGKVSLMTRDGRKRTCAYRTSNRDLLVPSSCIYDPVLLDLLFRLEPDEPQVLKSTDRVKKENQSNARQ